MPRRAYRTDISRSSRFVAESDYLETAAAGAWIATIAGEAALDCPDFRSGNPS
jgi:hypothetical protein